MLVNHPISFQGQTSNVVSITPQSVTLDRPVFLRNGRDYTLTQKIHIYDSQDATQEVVTTWNTFLQRDRAQLTEGWAQAEELASHIPQQSEIVIPDFNYDLWVRTQASTPLKSARGSGGFTVKEMRSLPQWVVEYLFDLFRCIEILGVWPQAWLFALTVMLPKTSTPESPLDLRPITILSRVYRSWSRYKAVALLVGLSNKIPKLIAGGTKNMSSLLLSAYFQETLESESLDSSCNGVTIDIIKCYNVIPRYPLSIFMRKMGWPASLVKTYMSALMNLQRSFQVLDTVSDWQKSYTGVPEGCALAVAAMLTLSASLYFYLKHFVPYCELITFADNWALKFLRAAETAYGIQMLEQFCSSLRLQISVPKSWMWALNDITITQIRGQTLQGVEIPLVASAKDLGVDITYRGRKNKTNLKKRLSLGLQRCNKVAQRKTPNKVGSRLLLSSCFPKAGFGTELMSPTKREFVNFRTVSARAMGMGKKGASPWLALNLTDKNLDFECFLLTRTVFFWRQYLKIFPDRKMAVLQKVCHPPKNGPIANFVDVCGKIGSFINNGTCILTSLFGDVDWIHCSTGFLHHVIQTQWNHRVCCHMTELPRKNFHCVASDLQGYKRAIAKFNPTDQQILRTHTCGAHYTLNAKSKYLEVEDACPFCKQPDSRSHRILDCTGLVRERSILSTTTVASLQDNPTLRHFGIPTIGFSIASLRTCLGSPNFDVDPIDSLFPFCPTDCDIPHIFTDGSCFFNRDRQFALAGSAFLAFTSVGHSTPFFAKRSLILPGQDHTSYRAEVFAILMVCRFFKRCIIYVDCQAAKSEMIHILEQICRGCTPTPADHADLWNAIINLVTKYEHDIQLVKVKAHADHLKHTDPFVAWCSQCNAQVDHEAKQAVTCDAHDVFQNFTNHHNTLCVQRQALGEIFEFQVKAAHKSFEVHAEQLQTQRAHTVFGKGCVPTANLVVWPTNLTLDQCKDCKFCPLFLHRISCWASKLEWEIDSPNHTTYIELMLSYIYDTRLYPPFPVLKYPHNPNCRAMVWLLKDQNPLRDFQGKNIGDLLSGFVRCINWAEKHLNVRIFPGEHKPDTTALSKYGYKGYKAAGFRSRARLPHQEAIDIYCNRFFTNRKAFDSPIP